MPFILKIITPQKRRQAALPFAKTESVTAVQSAFRTQFRTEPRHCVGFCGLLWKQARTPSVFALDTKGEAGLLTLRQHSFCWIVLY
jgi:hypothetical protein